MSPIARIALAAAFVAAFQSPAALALHRCVGKDGKVTYTEFECDADAKKSAVTIKDSSGFGEKKAGDPGKDAKAPAVIGGPSIIRAPQVPRAIAAQPAPVQQGAPGAAVGAPAAAQARPPGS